MHLKPLAHHRQKKNNNNSNVLPTCMLPLSLINLTQKPMSSSQFKEYTTGKPKAVHIHKLTKNIAQKLVVFSAESASPKIHALFMSQLMANNQMLKQML